MTYSLDDASDARIREMIRRLASTATMTGGGGPGETPGDGIDLAPGADTTAPARAGARTVAGGDGDDLSGADAELIREIVTTGFKLIGDGADRGDLKIINHALKEIRHAFRVFRPYRGERKVSIFGSARVERDDPTYRLAHDFARAIADRGFMTITGAGPGIMEAGNAGAGREHTFGLGIRLPFEQSSNEFIEGDAKVINFKYFFTRKLIFVKETDALVLFPGGFGTMDEGFETLTLIQTGKSKPMPVLCMDVPGGTYWPAWLEWIESQLVRGGRISPDDVDLFKIMDSVDAACDEIVRF
ncbi:MAG: LOG family protein, partial [Candidatus Eiseniibacteriota bacterium]